MLEMLTALTPIAALGALAFVVSAIVEVIKNLPGLKKIPTDAVVLFLSLVLTVIAVIVYLMLNGYPVLWYYVVGAIIGGFFVAYIAMYGWQKFKDLYDRYKK